MSLCIICFFRRLYSAHIDPGLDHSTASNLTAELEDSRKFTLNSVTALLAVLAATGSRTLQPVSLPLLMYTISLRLATNSCCLRNHPTLSGFLHSVPLFGIACVVAVALVVDLQSPGLAAVGIVLGTFPLLTLAIHHESWCGEASAGGLPMQMQDIRVLAAVSVGDTADGGDPTP